MERRQRVVETTVNEVTFSPGEMKLVEAVVAAYHSGHTADNLFMFNSAEPGEEVFAFDTLNMGNTIISALKQAATGKPSRIDIFELTDSQREQAEQMLVQYEEVPETR